MDVMDFDQTALYFDEPLVPEVERLLKEAADGYGEERAEALLHKAYFLEPESLQVLVALYRYYFYQHQLETALLVSERSLTLVGRRLGFPQSWTQLHPEFLGHAVLKSMGMLRFYLSLLKATGYLNLRLERRDEGRILLEKLVELDSHDRLGGRALLQLLTPDTVN